MGFFNDEAGSASITFVDARAKDKVTGVIIPDADGKAYVESNQTNFDTGEIETYKDGSPRKQAAVMLATELRDWDYATDQFKAKAKEDDDLVDNGVRRLFVRGASMTKAFKLALKKAKAKDIVPGMTVTVTLVERRPVPNSKFKENIFDVTVALPTEKTMAIVAEHADSGGALSTGSDDDASADSEPPF